MAKIALQGNDAGTGTLTLQAPVTNLNRNLVLPDVDGTLSTMEQVKLPIGSFMWFTGTVAPEAFIVADGELRSRAAFPDLWAFAQASGNISVDDASWTFGQYSPGNGSTTFRVPKVDDRFIRGASGTRPVGLVEEDAIGSHRHSLDLTQPSPISGAATWGASVIYPGNPNVLNSAQFGGDETRPKALTMLPCIKAYDVISDPAILNAVEVVNEISRLESEKLRKDENINLGVSVAASGTAVDFVGIPEGVKRITVMFDGVSTNGLVFPTIRLGAGSIETSGYHAITGASTSSVTGIHNASSGFEIRKAALANANLYGFLSFVRSVGNSWTFSSSLCGGGGEDYRTIVSSGYKTLSGSLDCIRVTTVNGTDQFDAGTINISWEF